MRKLQTLTKLVMLGLGKVSLVIRWGIPGCILGMVIMALSFLDAPTLNSEGSFRTFQIQVDSVTLASTFAASDTMQLQFQGTIGPNGCYEFSHKTLTLISLKTVR